MKLLIALTPAVLIGCALIETWASIMAEKQPFPAAASTAVTPAPRAVPVFTFGGEPTPVAAVSAPAAPWAVAKAQAGKPSAP